MHYHLQAMTRTARPICAALLLLLATAAARAQDPGDGMMGDGEMMGRTGVVHDPAYFAERVLPLLDRECSGCHDAGDPDNKTTYRLLPRDTDAGWSPEAVQDSYEMIVALLAAPAPERSRVLLKLAPLPQGGIDHDGGKADGTDFDVALLDPKGPLVQWTFGATKTRAAPVAVVAPVPATIERGTRLDLDASLSFDPDGDKVAITWELVEAPLGAKARLTAASGPKTSVTPDRDGPWVIRCRPTDGRMGGWPVLLRVDVTRPKETTGAAAPVPAGRIESAERRLTRALFFDLLGRSPAADEVAEYAALPHTERVDRLLDTTAAWEHWFDEEAFYFLLIDGFRPVSDRLAAVPAKMRDGLASFRDAHTEFALSAEFNSRNPGNDTYVTVVLEQLLGVQVQSEPRLLKEAKRMYDGEKTRIFNVLGNSQSDVVRITLDQPGYVDLFCRRMELRYLGAPLPDAEHAIAVERLRLDPRELRPLLREWLVSARYAGPDRAAKAKNDHQFIRGLFVDLLGRPPALQEFRNMRNALQALTDPAPLRGVLAKVMLDSGAVIPPAGTDTGRTREGARTGETADTTRVSGAQVDDLFHRLLGRDPTPDEKSAFLDVLSEPGATWLTAALALLTSPHYQYY